jgi:RraA family protein
MSNIGGRIFTKVNRPNSCIVELFQELNSADVADCMNKLASMDSGLRPLNSVKLLGTAVTVKVPEGNNLLFHQAISVAQRGDVIVVDGGGFIDRGLCGENMIEIARQRGIRGFVVDGAVRDSAAINACDDFSVYARSVVPNASYKVALPGEINVPVSIGGIVVYPGDIILGDRDGIISVRPASAEKIAAETKSLAEKQAANLKLIKQETSNRDWVLQMVKDAGCIFINKAWDEE